MVTGWGIRNKVKGYFSHHKVNIMVNGLMICDMVMVLWDCCQIVTIVTVVLIALYIVVSGSRMCLFRVRLDIVMVMYILVRLTSSIHHT